MPYSDDTVFAAAAGPAPLNRRWGELTVVYHPLSAETHLLDATGARLLQLLQESPQPLSELRRHLYRELSGQSGEAEVAAYLERALQQLVSIELLQVQEVRAG